MSLSNKMLSAVEWELLSKLNPRGLVCTKVLLVAGILAVVAFAVPTAATAQTKSKNRHFPLDQSSPPGMAGQWAGARRGFVPKMQPIRVELPDGGTISYYTSPTGESQSAESSTVVALRVGSVYRLKITDMPGMLGAELYPTVELIDCLHPPAGREAEFPIPVALTSEEISLALEGRLVTKVVYLEQANRADPVGATNASRSRFARPSDNILALADEAGRPMAIIRIGGRSPDAAAIETGYFGTGAPVQILESVPAIKKANSP